MIRQEHRDSWQEIKEIWGNSSQGERFNSRFAILKDALNSKISKWEKAAITSDLIKIQSSMEDYKSQVSVWEKKGVSKDLSRVLKLIKRRVKKLGRKN